MEPQETASAAKWVNLWLLDSDGIEKGLDGYVDIDMSDAADAKYFDTICQEAGEGITKQLRGFLTSELAELGAAGQAGLADLAKDMESCRYNLARLPANYKVVKKHDPTQDHGPYRYYIVGHPATEFTGTKDFLPHLIWLANKRRGKCSCRACNLKPVAATRKPAMSAQRRCIASMFVPGH